MPSCSRLAWRELRSKLFEGLRESASKQAALCHHNLGKGLVEGALCDIRALVACKWGEPSALAVRQGSKWGSRLPLNCQLHVPLAPVMCGAAVLSHTGGTGQLVAAQINASPDSLPAWKKGEPVLSFTRGSAASASTTSMPCRWGNRKPRKWENL